MKLITVWLLAGLGCRPDPELEAWHGAVEIDSAREGLDACDAELAPIEPVEDYVFIAIDRGIPDLATLYWCSAPEDCPFPLASAYLRELDTERIQGDEAQSELHGNLCSIEWTDVAASQEGGQVEITVRTGLVDQEVTGSDACVELETQAIGGQCDAVLSLTGTRVIE